jgi:hypothetical protein
MSGTSESRGIPVEFTESGDGGVDFPAAKAWATIKAMTVRLGGAR